MATIGSVLATGSSACNSTEMLSDVDSFSVSSVQDLETSLFKTSTPLYVKSKQVVEVVVPPQPAWVNQHLSEKKSVMKITGPATASKSLAETLAAAFSNNGVQPSPSLSPFKRISLATPGAVRQSLQHASSTLSSSPSLPCLPSPPSSPHNSPTHSFQQESAPTSPHPADTP
ncbi:hypothetical protein BDN71DRAFT_1443020 [Pleurotus eryngii]|uniref:Uncharacterized protein n=1 Tax=Pleurotus eryngii TaxID=5323 RepID=A0A9P6DJ07_PLEER|nr:hypothetical protein BDN71DRAFT_1443020 [Pleurotus eryngii]